MQQERRVDSASTRRVRILSSEHREGTDGWSAGQRHDLVSVLKSSLCLLCGGTVWARVPSYREARKEAATGVQAGDGSKTRAVVREK